MKSTKGTISEALAQVAAYNKEQRPVVEAETEARKKMKQEKEYRQIKDALEEEKMKAERFHN